MSAAQSGASALKAKLDSLKQRLKPGEEAKKDTESDAKKAKVDDAKKEGINGAAAAKPAAKATAKLGARPKASAAPSPPASPPPEPEEVVPEEEPPATHDPSTPWVPTKKLATPKGAGIKMTITTVDKPVVKTEEADPTVGGGLPIEKLRRLARFHCARHGPSADEAEIIAALRKVGVDSGEIEKTLEIAKPTAKAKPGAKAKAESKAGPKAKAGAKADDKAEEKEGDAAGKKERKRKWKPAFAVTEFEWNSEAKKQTVSAVAAKAVSGAAPQLALPGPVGFNAPMPGPAPPSAKMPSGARPPFGGARPPPKATASLPGSTPGPAAPSAKMPSGAVAGLGARPKASAKAPSSSWGTGFPGGSPSPMPMGSPSGKPKDVCWEFAKGKCHKGAACKWSHDM